MSSYTSYKALRCEAVVKSTFAYRPSIVSSELGALLPGVLCTFFISPSENGLNKSYPKFNTTVCF